MVSEGVSPAHRGYLEKVGFVLESEEQDLYRKQL